MSDITLEDLLIAEALDYKTSHGARGQQLIIRECPKCGSDKWKCYAGAESGLGNCFACSWTYNHWKFAAALLENQGKPCGNRDIGRYLDDHRRKLGYRPKARVAAKPFVAVVNTFELPSCGELPYSDGWIPPYLLERGINGHYARMFHLRFCAAGFNRYKNEQGEEIRQKFHNRIIIPVFDLDAKMVTYQGRAIDKGVEPRYKFAGGLPGTGRYLLNGHVARAQRASQAVLVEGPFDVIGAQKAIDSASDLTGMVPLGTFGKHLSVQSDGVDQVSALRELRKGGLKEATFMWDGEPTAWLDALDASMELIKIGITPKIACLPPGQDPGEADASVICDAIRSAREVTRVSILRLRMQNPYSKAA